jgi:hypothetical protein
MCYYAMSGLCYEIEIYISFWLLLTAAAFELRNRLSHVVLLENDWITYITILASTVQCKLYLPVLS